MVRARGLHFNSVELIFSLVLALALAWTVGTWLGSIIARRARGEERPPRTVRGLMTLVFVGALVLSLMAGEPSVLLYALVLIPLIASLTYLSRSR